MNNNENNKVTYAIIGIVIGLILAFIFSPMMGWSRSMMSGRNNGSLNQGNMNISGIDRHFIEQMIPHHEGAIDMANLALSKSTHPEIKTLASAIIKAQTEENNSMRSWYQSWFGSAVPDGGTSMMGGMMSGNGMHMGGSEDLEALASATDFDKAFIEQMIPHHQMAIMMARMLESGTNREEMLQLAKNIQSSQAAEIKQMQGWYESWYK